jgi:hypothetical protein
VAAKSWIYRPDGSQSARDLSRWRRIPLGCDFGARILEAVLYRGRVGREFVAEFEPGGLIYGPGRPMPDWDGDVLPWIGLKGWESGPVRLFLTPAEAVRFADHFGVTIAGKAQGRSNPDVTSAGELRPRQEFILAGWNQRRPGPWRAYQIAGWLNVCCNSQFRADLSELRKLGYLDHDGRGYIRVDRPTLSRDTMSGTR